MAVPTLTNLPNKINAADVSTDWSGRSLNTDPDITVDGGGTVTANLDSDGDELLYTAATILYTSGTAAHVRGWIQFTALSNLDFMEFTLQNTQNSAFWEIFKGANYAGSNNPPLYTGGFFYVVQNLGATPDAGSLGAGSQTYTDIGYRFQRVSNPRNVTNTFADVLWIGDGYTATGGTEADPITFTTIATEDSKSAIGVVQTNKEVNFIYGDVTIGASGNQTYCKAENEAVVFVDAPVSSTLYGIEAGTNSTLDFTSTLFKANAAQTFSFNTQSASSLICEGNSFIQASPVTFGSGQTVTSCTFVDCGSTTTNGAIISRGSFTDSGTVNVDSLSELDRCTFIRTTGTEHAVVLANTAETTSMNWSCDASEGYASGSLGSFSSGNASSSSAAIHYTGSSDLTINVLATGTTPSIRVSNAANPTVTVAAPPAKFILTGLKPKTEVRLINSTTNVEIAGVETVSSAEAVGINNGTLYSGNITVSSDVVATESKFTYEYQYPGSDVPLLVAILSSSTYQVVYLESSLISAGREIPVQQRLDRNSNL